MTNSERFTQCWKEAKAEWNRPFINKSKWTLHQLFSYKLKESYRKDREAKKDMVAEINSFYKVGRYSSKKYYAF